jgi:ElaB/YqjD/DUF883 family membrane-anchored ribosome-binding protein
MNNGNNGNANMGGSDKLGAIKDRVKGLVDSGEAKVDQLKHKAADVKDQAFTRGNAMLDRATDFIRTNPLKSVGIAFGVGYIGMRLFRR